MRGWITKVGEVVHNTFWGGEGGRVDERRRTRTEETNEENEEKEKHYSLSLHTL